MENTRARLLKAVAESIVASGEEIPLDKKRLVQLPGVGEYVANAVLCFSMGADVPLVDTNAIRVVQRVFSFKSRKARPREDKAIWDFVSSLIPAKKGRLFNMALLDFGRLVCTNRNPQCPTCEVNSICDYYRLGRARQLNEAH
jgi:A/G-specific adenine glycosylase